MKTYANNSCLPIKSDWDQKSLVPIDEFKNTILHLAANEESLVNHEIVFYCMIMNLNDKNPRNNEGLTPLHISALKGNLKIFLGYVEEKNPKDFLGRTPVHFAAMRGHLSVCRLITKNVTDTNPIDVHGQTPFYLAARNGHQNVCRWLFFTLRSKIMYDLELYLIN